MIEVQIRLFVPVFKLHFGALGVCVIMRAVFVVYQIYTIWHSCILR